MFSSTICLAFGLFLLQIEQAKGASTTLGTHYLIALPPNNLGDPRRYEVSFFLFTLSLQDVEVELTTPWYEPKPLDIKKTVKRLEVVDIPLNRKYLSRVQVGKKFSYRLHGTGKFGLIVFDVVTHFIADSFIGLPVEGWAKKYIVVASWQNPTFQVLTTEENEITIKLKMTGFNFTYVDVTYFSGSTLRVTLKKFEAFGMAFCCEYCRDDRTLTGTTVEGVKSIGLISGDCLAKTSILSCEHMLPHTWEYGARDLYLEMLTPVVSYGKEFITLVVTRMVQGFNMVISSEDSTTITISEGGGSKYPPVFLAKAGDSAVLPFQDARAFRSDKPIQAFYYQSSPCVYRDIIQHTTEPEGDGSLSILVATNLFYDGYIWSTPFSRITTPHNFFVAVVKAAELQFLRLDHHELNETTITPVHGADYVVVNRNITQGSHNLYGVKTVYFGCYIYGLAKYYSYTNPAGYISAEINKKCVPNFEMQPGDLIDNDCDGSIDEEVVNGRDDDNDKRIDEDVGKPPRTDGQWSHWSEWECVLECGKYGHTRRRACDNPPPVSDGDNCEGESFLRKDSNCGKNLTCPSDCGFNRWYFGCARSCENCDGDCDKFTGTCAKCKTGYGSPELSCSQFCPAYTFGANCLGRCMEKCGTECLDKFEGTCPPSEVNNRKYLWWLTLLIPIVGFFLFIASIRHIDTICEEEEGYYTFDTTKAAAPTVELRLVDTTEAASPTIELHM
ncbi:uncharacterized protein LOC131944071 [Physella acuta]|uniref:uncharacterized protein LOC131944071 n=1 Tax=Physella acuta TaxID=109671 RepID=UPI0027DCB568|nr:uncharacterized protein LOC131944071 [Physella acuta]